MGFEDDKGNPVGREELLRRMHDHIFAVVGRYTGRIERLGRGQRSAERGWHAAVVAWLRIIGDDYIAKAFEYVHAADPKAELYYNEYSLETRPSAKAALS